jgi:hypothetical protein
MATQTKTEKQEGRKTARTEKQEKKQSVAGKQRGAPRKGGVGGASTSAVGAPVSGSVVEPKQVTPLEPSAIISRGVLTDEHHAAEALLTAISQQYETPTQMTEYAKAAEEDELLRITRAVGVTYRTASQFVVKFRPVILELRDRHRRPGRRVADPDCPSWTAIVPECFGFTVRRLNQLLAAPAAGSSKPGRKTHRAELPAAQAGGDLNTKAAVDRLTRDRDERVEEVYRVISPDLAELRRTDPQMCRDDLLELFQRVVNRLYGNEVSFAVRFDDCKRPADPVD